MARLKKHYKLILTILVGLGLSFAAYSFYDYHRKFRSSLIHLMPVDINKDGVDDLIRIYGGRGSQANFSLVEAYDQKNDRVLWHTKTTRAHYVSDFQQLMAISKTTLIYAIKAPGGFGIQALNLQTGEPKWTYKPIIGKQKSKIFPHYFARFLIHKNSLSITYVDKFELPIESLLIIDIRNGKVIQNRKFPRYKSPSMLNIREGNLLLNLSKNIQIINTTTGQLQASFEGSMPWTYKNKLLVLSGKKRLMELDLNKAALIPFPPFAGKHLDRDHFSTMLGVYRDELFELRWNPARRESTLYVYSMKTGKAHKTLRLPKNFRRYRWYMSFSKHWNIEGYSYHKIPGRFLPIFASFSKKNETFGKWIILDLENHNISWQSKTYAGHGNLTTNDVVFAKNGFYFLELSLRDPPSAHYSLRREHKSLLILDGATGKFKATLDFGNGRSKVSLSLYAPHRPSQVRKNILYGKAMNEAEYWSYDLNTMLPVFPDSDAVTLPSARKFVEGQLGALPW